MLFFFIFIVTLFQDPHYGNTQDGIGIIELEDSLIHIGFFEAGDYGIWTIEALPNKGYYHETLCVNNTDYFINVEFLEHDLYQIGWQLKDGIGSIVVKDEHLIKSLAKKRKKLLKIVPKQSDLKRRKNSLTYLKKDTKTTFWINRHGEAILNHTQKNNTQKKSIKLFVIE